MRTKAYGMRVSRARLFRLAAAALCLATCSGDGERGAPGGPSFDGPVLATADTTVRASALATRPTTVPTAVLQVQQVGAVPGSGWVGHDGAYHYRIPIEVPPGRAGMAPSLALAYSSRAGNSEVGVGFSLDDASSITRCDTIMAGGGVRDKVLFKKYDKYCLDGQRLMLLSGLAGEVGSHYRTEVDNFTRVKIAARSGGDIVKWTAETKDGRTLIYEALADTVATNSPEPWTQRQLVKADGTPNGAPTVFHLTWPLTKQYDRSGNGIRYSYTRSSNQPVLGAGNPVNDGGADAPLLSQIDYTTCEITPCAFPDTARPRRVVLTYEARPAGDRIERWVNGAVVRINVRLKMIQPRVLGDDGIWWPQRSYSLMYWTDDQDPANHRVTRRSLLQSVDLCEGFDPRGPLVARCLTPTTFDWQSRAQHKVRSQGVENGFRHKGFVGAATQMEFLVFDANGDGNDDVLVHEPSQRAVVTEGVGVFPQGTIYKERLLIADGGGQFKSAVDVNWNAGACKGIRNVAMALPVDLDGNGKTELVIECGKYGVLAWDPSLGTLSEVDVPGISNVELPDRTTPSGGREGHIKLADLTGDGLPELLTTAKEGTESFRRWQRQDAQYTRRTPVWGPQISYGPLLSTNVRVDGPEVQDGDRVLKLVPKATTVLDLDGNGHEELVQMDLRSAMRSYSGPPDLGQQHSYRFQDVANNVKWVTETEAPANEPSWGIATYGTSTQGQSLWFFADVNGDGLKDALYTTATPTATLFSLRINTGEGFGVPVALDTSRCQPRSGGFAGTDSNVLIADLNGDGRDDLVWLTGAGHLATPNWTGFAGTRDGIRVCHSNGAGFDAPINLPMPAGGYRLFYDRYFFQFPGGSGSAFAERHPLTQVGDFNGDGVAEVVDFLAGDTTAWTQGYREAKVTLLDPDAIRGGVDLITKVSDARGTRQQIAYDTLSAGTRARYIAANVPQGLRDTHLPAGGDYPMASMQKGAAVRTLADEGHAAPGRSSKTLHLYEGARTGVTGRGFLGFARHTTVDQTTGDVTRYDFSMSSFSPGIGGYYLYPRTMRPSGVQIRADFSGTTELAPPDATLPAATGVVSAPASTISEIYEGSPLRLDRIYQDDYQRTRTNGGPLTETGSHTFRQIGYDDWGNVTSDWTETTETADPTFTARYTHNVTTQLDNIVNDTTWRLGETRRVVDTTTATDPYRTSTDASDTRTTSFAYDSKGRLAVMSREPGGANNEHLGTIYSRNGAGLVTAVSRYAMTGQTCGVDDDCDESKQEYCAGQCWRPRTESFGYDVSGTFVESFTNALGQTRWVLVHPRTLLPYLSADENGVATTITRDGLGRVRETKSDTGGTTTVNYAHDVFGGFDYDIVRTTEPTGAQHSIFLHRFGIPQYRSWSSFSGGSGATVSTFDALGNITATRYKSSTLSEAAVAASVQTIENTAIGGLALSKASYDRAGRLLTSSRSTIEESSFAYPAYGKTEVSDGEGLSSSTTVDSAGRVVARTQGTHEIHYRYKGDGQLASILGTDNHIERFTFDKLGRKTRWTTSVVGETEMERLGAVSYDAFDQMTGFSRDGVPITQGYDVLGRVVSRGSGTEVGQTYIWGTATGEIGRLKRAYHNDLSHDIVNTYNARSQLTERREKFVNGATSLSFGYEYDTVGRLYRLRYPEANSTDVSAVSHQSRGGPTVQYNYQNGQLRSITEVATGNPILWRADTRHVFGMATAATYGSPSDTNRLTASWDYNPGTLRLEGHDVARANASPAPTQDFTYYDNGKLKTRTSSGLSESYTYSGALGFLATYRRGDANGQRLVDATFSYDDTGMTGIRTAASLASPDWPGDETMTASTPDYTYRLREHRVGSGPQRIHIYDTAGRVHTVRDRGASCSVTTACPSGYRCEGTGCFRTRRDISWNSFNLPTRIDYQSPGLTRAFGYDAFGNRVRKTEDAANQVLYLGKLYEQRNLTTLGAKESVYRLYTDVGVVAELVHPWGGTSRTTRYLFTDHQGSIAYSVVNRVPTQLGFFPYGKRMGNAPTQNFSQLGYTGHYQDDDLDLVNMGGRIYDVATRRFLSRDRVADSPLQVFGTHAYAYVAHDPVNRIDPTGFEAAYQGQGSSSADCRTNNSCPIPIVLPDRLPMPPKAPSSAAPQPTQQDLRRQQLLADAASAAAANGARPVVLPGLSHADQQAMAASGAGMGLVDPTPVPSVPAPPSRTIADRVRDTMNNLELSKGTDGDIDLALTLKVVDKEQFKMGVELSPSGVTGEVVVGDWQSDYFKIDETLSVRLVANGPQGEFAVGPSTGGGASLFKAGGELEISEIGRLGLAFKPGVGGRVDVKTGAGAYNFGAMEVTGEVHGRMIIRNLGTARQNLQRYVDFLPVARARMFAQ